MNVISLFNGMGTLRQAFFIRKIMRFTSMETIKRRSTPHYVYYLICPLTKEIRYIGTTSNVRLRYNGHIASKKDNEKTKWIKYLLNQNLRPILKVAYTFKNKKLAVEKELHLIATTRNLYNISKTH